MPSGPRRFPRLENARYRKVKADLLRFDSENPRLGGAAVGNSQDEIQEYLVGEPHYALNLVGSLVENGFLPYEPLVVRQEGDKFIVIEGNRRLAAVRAILGAPTKYPQEVRDRLNEIPVLAFPEGADRDSEEVQRYLGVKHLFGFRDWTPLSKAIFLDKRLKSEKDLPQVLRELNIKRQEAARYLVPYRLTKAAKRVFRHVNVEDFWSLAESFGRKNIRLYIQLDVDRRTMKIMFFNPRKLHHLVQFLYGKRRLVTDTRQLSTLSRILGSPEAARQLEHGGTLEEASLFVRPKEETIAQLVRQMERVFERIKKLSPGKKESADIVEILQQFSRKLEK